MLPRIRALNSPEPPDSPHAHPHPPPPDHGRLRDQIDKVLASDRALSLVVAIETALEDGRYEVRPLGGREGGTEGEGEGWDGMGWDGTEARREVQACALQFRHACPHCTRQPARAWQPPPARPPAMMAVLLWLAGRRLSVVPLLLVDLLRVAHSSSYLPYLSLLLCLMCRGQTSCLRCSLIRSTTWLDNLQEAARLRDQFRALKDAQQRQQQQEGGQGQQSAPPSGSTSGSGSGSGSSFSPEI